MPGVERPLCGSPARGGGKDRVASLRAASPSRVPTSPLVGAQPAAQPNLEPVVVCGGKPRSAPTAAQPSCTRAGVTWGSAVPCLLQVLPQGFVTAGSASRFLQRPWEEPSPAASLFLLPCPVTYACYRMPGPWGGWGPPQSREPLLRAGAWD